MMIGSENIATSAEKILQAATSLFALNNFNAVSIKQIANASGCNSALISYYFGGKKNLYQEVLNAQAVIFFKLVDDIRKMDISPLAKLRHYVDALSKIQETNPESIPLICRELLAPQPIFEKFVKNKLYALHQFMTELVTEAIEREEIQTEIKPTHVAFTLESTIMFFYLTQNQIRELGNYAPGEQDSYLNQVLDTYLASLSR
ncbi:MAG: CerR family C-terminal domain-containing protein [Phascolarctobacterium sp.]|nr:CerR family C-terminal domain-containing protein [Phascolarctobacterium sp.]